MAKQKASPAVAKDLLTSFLTTLAGGFETNTDLETKSGVAFEYTGYGTFIMKRAVHRNAEYAKALKEKLLPLIEKQGDNEAEATRLMAEIYADTVIVGLKSADGTTIPYDDKAKKGIAKLFVSAPDLFSKIQADASDAANYRKKRTEAEAKN